MITNKFGSPGETDRRENVISCHTCKVTQKFYSEFGVANFRLNHMGHNVKEGPITQAELTPRKASETLQTISPAVETPIKRELREEIPRRMPVVEAEEPSVPVSKLLVDIAARRENEKPAFRLWAFKEDGMDAFTHTIPLENQSELKGLLERRQFVDKTLGDEIKFTWTEDVIEMSADVKAKLLVVPRPESRPVQAPPVELKTKTSSMDTERRPESVPKVEIKRRVESVPNIEVKPKEVRPPRLVERSPVEPPAVEIQHRKTSELPRPEKREDKTEESLLLAKSSYIQEGEENRREAIRLSRVLRAFRWNIEPAYMLGVVFDGNVSVETNIGVISGSLIQKVESLGYNLVAVNVNLERPTAWFKKRTPLSAAIPTEGDRARELQRRLEEETRRLDEERRRFDQERTGWQQRFTLLTKLVTSMNPTEGLEGVQSESSEIQPEPDVIS